MPIAEETLSIAIPAALKTEHPDSALVVQGILIALRADENSTALTAKGRMRAVHDALLNLFAPELAAHLAKEDEDWGALKAKADRYRPHVIVTPKRERDTIAQYAFAGDESGTAFAMREDGGWVAELMSDGVVSQQSSPFPTPREAVRSLFEGRGIMVSFDAPAYQAPAPSYSEPVPTAEAPTPAME